MSTFSQFTGGGGIKSIQRGTISATTAGATATISSVNTAKAELRFLGGSGIYSDINGLSALVPRLVLTNSTTITATVSANPSTAAAVVSWELTEWN